ncbi:unnamed protein product [Oikopleura dioica]|uniref:Uncharacterized protein n=1 Tax=Oikopleura dioica TaxID=34765 RepID=E4Y619_OIKDI|nr:unnamed protein product [Oikopleura dioica]
MAGLNLNPNENEKEFQTNEIELLLERVCKKTYLMESGWQIIRELDYSEKHRPKRSTCKFENVLLNENFNFTRPLTVTGAFLLPDLVTVFFHQMVLDRIDNPTDCFNAEYVIHNTSFDEGGPVLKIPKTRAYYVNEFMMQNNQTGPNEYKYYGQNGEFMWLVNENYQNMQPNTWYLLPQAYSLTLVPEPGYDSDSSDLSDPSEP